MNRMHAVICSSGRWQRIVERFSAVVCFTMLHHLPSPEAQNRLLSFRLRARKPAAAAR
jgi:hypothetical protein